MYQVEWKKRAMKELKRIDRPEQSKIFAAAGELTNFPECSNIKHLSGGLYRRRVGSYRILFTADEVVQIVTVEHVRKRNERTYHKI